MLAIRRGVDGNTFQDANPTGCSGSSGLTPPKWTRNPKSGRLQRPFSRVGSRLKRLAWAVRNTAPLGGHYPRPQRFGGIGARLNAEKRHALITAIASYWKNNAADLSRVWWRRNATRQERRIVAFLIACSDRFGMSAVGQRELAQALHVHQSTVSRALHAACRAGAVRKVRRKVRLGDRFYEPCVYQVRGAIRDAEIGRELVRLRARCMELLAFSAIDLLNLDSAKHKSEPKARSDPDLDAIRERCRANKALSEPPSPLSLTRRGIKSAPDGAQQ